MLPVSWSPIITPLFLSICSPALSQLDHLQTRLCPVYPPVCVVMMLSLIIFHRCALYLSVGMVVVVLVRKASKNWQCCPKGLDLLMIGHSHRASSQLPAPPQPPPPPPTLSYNNPSNSLHPICTGLLELIASGTQ